MSDKDTIYRQDAIDALESGKDKTAKGDIGGFYNAIIQNNMDKLRNLPSAEPERKKGKWILVTDNRGQHFECDKCGEWRYHQGQKFCSHCGADMREGEEE